MLLASGSESVSLFDVNRGCPCWSAEHETGHAADTRPAYTGMGSTPFSIEGITASLHSQSLGIGTSRHLRALLSVCGRCSFGGSGCCSCRVRVCRCRGCCSLSVCVCDLLIFFYNKPTNKCETNCSGSLVAAGQLGLTCLRWDGRRSLLDRRHHRVAP